MVSDIDGIQLGLIHSGDGIKEYYLIRRLGKILEVSTSVGNRVSYRIRAWSDLPSSIPKPVLIQILDSEP